MCPHCITDLTERQKLGVMLVQEDGSAFTDDLDTGTYVLEGICPDDCLMGHADLLLDRHLISP